MDTCQLIILLDSSTSYEPGMQTGPSVCFWSAYIYRPHSDEHPISRNLPEDLRFENAILMEALRKKPIRSGAIYNNVDGPVRMFYDGIIRALDACYYLIKREEVTETIVLGGDQYVFHQINGESAIDELEPVYNQVQKLRERYEKQRVHIMFQYIREDDYSLYGKLHTLTQGLQTLIKETFK